MNDPQTQTPTALKVLQAATQGTFAPPGSDDDGTGICPVGCPACGDDDDDADGPVRSVKR